MELTFIMVNIGVGLLIFSLIWMVYTSSERSAIISEIDRIKSEFFSCDSKIMNVVKEGSYEECRFSVEKGVLTIQGNIIDYQAVENEICEPKGWENLGGRIIERCVERDSLTIYQIRWESPNVFFQKYGKRGNRIGFRKLSEIDIDGAKGYLLSVSIM
jgi:hypothetical protein